jgi:hypothetical protein
MKSLECLNAKFSDLCITRPAGAAERAKVALA